MQSEHNGSAFRWKATKSAGEQPPATIVVFALTFVLTNAAR